MNSEPVTMDCPDDEIFCLQENQCIPRETICMQSTNVVNGRGLQENCRDDEIFCLAAGKCIVQKDCEDEIMQDNGYQRKCYDDEYFCLQQGRCVKSSEPCKEQSNIPYSPPDANRACMENEYFCLQSGRCMQLEDLCAESNARVCGNGLIYCLQTNNCIPTKETCNNRVKEGENFICHANENFCLQKGVCLPNEDRCGRGSDMQTTTESQTWTATCREDKVSFSRFSIIYSVESKHERISRLCKPFSAKKCSERNHSDIFDDLNAHSVCVKKMSIFDFSFRKKLKTVKYG